METVAQQRASAQRCGTSPLYQVLAEDIVAMGVEAAFGLISDDTALLACGNPARTDLGGGRSVTTVPTALRSELYGV